MPDMSRPASGTQPGPDLTVPSLPSAPAGIPVGDRRRSSVSISANDGLGAPETDAETLNERTFLELRRKVQCCGLLAASTEKLLWKMKFNGHLTVVVQNGRVVKSGYEEGYFRRKNDLGGILFET